MAVQYTDSVTGDIVTDPILNYNGVLINPATDNTVIADSSPTMQPFKAIEIEAESLFGDYTSDAKYLGALISEDTRLFMVTAGMPFKPGDIVTVDGMDKNILKVVSIKPGDIEIYKLIQVKR